MNQLKILKTKHEIIVRIVLPKLSSEEKYELLEDANDRGRDKAFDAARLQASKGGL